MPFLTLCISHVPPSLLHRILFSGLQDTAHTSLVLLVGVGVTGAVDGVAVVCGGLEVRGVGDCQGDGDAAFLVKVAEAIVRFGYIVQF